MRIFFVTNNYTPYSGGVISSINATTQALQAQGHTVFIITLDFLGKNDKPQAQSTIALLCPPKLSAKDGATADPDYVIRIFCPIKFMYKKNHMAIPWRPTHAITQLLQQYKPDIVHVHHPFLLGADALYAAHKHNIPCIFTYHTIYEDYAHYVPLPSFIIKPLIRYIVTRFCKYVDGIIAPSNAIKEYLLSQNIKTPIKIIPSPLRPEFLTSENLHKSYLPQSGVYPEFKLLVVSRFVPEKNIPFIFDVFKQLLALRPFVLPVRRSLGEDGSVSKDSKVGPNTFTLNLVGYGSDYEKMQYLAFNTLKLSKERVHFIHKPPMDELLNYYRNADLFLFPSQTDTQGIVLAEAMSQGLPVIAIDGPGQRDIIVQGKNGFIVKNAYDAAKTIIDIANNPILYEQLSQNAYITAQQYHAHLLTKQLIDFYHTILS